MKLNYKRTILVGFAFFLISAFWQAYDTYVPLILNNKFGMSQGASGFIMTLDNIVAVFLLPVFGALSDKCTSKHGRRKPFVLIGTVCAVIALVGLTVMDGVQLKNIQAVSQVDDPAALVMIYESQADKTLKDPDGNDIVIGDVFTVDEFSALRSTDPEIEPEAKSNRTKMNDYTRYVVPARQAYIGDITDANPNALIVFIGILLVLLLAMSTFRSPAVALMPDVTIKPLRSKGNAVINLMGAAGGCLVLALGIVLKTGKPNNIMMSYTSVFMIVGGIMLAALFAFTLCVKEKKWVQEMQEDTLKYGVEEEEEQNAGRKLTKSEKISLLLVLASVFLWYFGYNAVSTKYSVYAGMILRKDHNTTLIIAQAAAIISYIPAGMLASKLGRKKTILVGVLVLTAAFVAAYFMSASQPVLLLNLLFAAAGIGWATINVNSFPMVVELCSGGDVGKYTGYYYTASMAAQALTPTISGILMDQFGMRNVLFPYSAIFVGLAFITMLLVKHGDAKPETKIGLEALDVDD